MMAKRGKISPKEVKPKYVGLKRTKIPDIFVDVAIIAAIFGVFYGLILIIYVFGG